MLRTAGSWLDVRHRLAERLGLLTAAVIATKTIHTRLSL